MRIVVVLFTLCVVIDLTIKLLVGNVNTLGDILWPINALIWAWVAEVNYAS